MILCTEAKASVLVASSFFLLSCIHRICSGSCILWYTANLPAAGTAGACLETKMHYVVYRSISQEIFRRR